ncbi:MAG: histidine kinase [Dehalococcoidales bacterium]|nr:histidine kinase [Dehalococcoidales bacterium]
MNRTEQHIAETKRLGRVLIFLRWLYIPAILLTAWLCGWVAEPLILTAVLGLAAINLIALYLNPRINKYRHQQVLGMTMLGADFLAGWALIFTGINDGHSFIYIAFTPIVVETAMLLGLWGALVMDIIFGGIMRLGWVYLYARDGTQFDLPDFLLILGVMSFISLMVGMVAREWRKQRRWAEKLASEQALLLERRRISSELHDSVLKSLHGLSLEAYALNQDNNQKKEMLAEKSRYIQDVCQLLSSQIRGLIMDLRDEGGTSDILPGVKNMVDSWSQSRGVPVNIILYNTEIQAGLKTSQDINKIIAEALLNIERHSEASQVGLAIKTENGQMKLEISDNGHGFDLPSGDLYQLLGKGKLGLLSMKERVELAGGNLQIESSPQGTRLSIRIPIEEGAP